MLGLNHVTAAEETKNSKIWSNRMLQKIVPTLRNNHLFTNVLALCRYADKMINSWKNVKALTANAEVFLSAGSVKWNSLIGLNLCLHTSES